MLTGRRTSEQLKEAEAVYCIEDCHMMSWTHYSRVGSHIGFDTTTSCKVYCPMQGFLVVTGCCYLKLVAEAAAPKSS